MPDAILNEQLLESKLTELEKAKAWSPRIISRLESTIRNAADFDLFRINPVQYAAEKRDRVVDYTVVECIGVFSSHKHCISVIPGREPHLTMGLVRKNEVVNPHTAVSSRPVFDI